MSNNNLKQAIYLLVLFSFISPHSAYAESCYDVTGKISAFNSYFLNEEGVPTQTGLQIGKLKLKLTDQYGETFFFERAKLSGQIVGNHETGVFLNHSIFFRDGGKINTWNDEASFTSVRAVDFNGIPCSFNIVEYVTDATGGGLFSDITSIDFVIEGYISFCLDENADLVENKNKLTVSSGTFCLGN